MRTARIVGALLLLGVGYPFLAAGYFGLKLVRKAERIAEKAGV